MDILGMLNDYLKNNKSDEQLANEFIALFNKGQSLEQVAKLYEYSPEKVKEILKNTGYISYGYPQKWKRTNSSQLNVKPKKAVNNENITEEQLADEFVTLLNKGQTIEKVAEIHSYSPESITEILTNVGYKYFGFSKKWKKTNQPKNAKSKASKKQSKTKSSSYDTGLVQTSKPIENETYQISDIINKLNNGISILEVAVWYRITEGGLRQLLKRNKYRYDRIFKVWTNLTRKEYLKQLASDLYNGKVSLNKINKNGVNIDVVEMELIKSGFKYKKDNNTLKSSKINTNQNGKTNLGGSNKLQPLITEEMLLKEEKDESLEFLLKEKATYNDFPSTDDKKVKTASHKELFTKEELANLKEMIYSWNEKKKDESLVTSPKIETTIYLNQDLLLQLTKTSEKVGLSRSMIIEKALKTYLNK
jgi:hypothetical protein